MVGQHSPCLNKWGKFAEIIARWWTHRNISGEVGSDAWDISSFPYFLRIPASDDGVK